MIRHSASIVNRSSHPLEILKMAHVQGGDCFCLRYLLSDESWRIELTQKTMKMDFCVVFCDRVETYRDVTSVPTFLCACSASYSMHASDYNGQLRLCTSLLCGNTLGNRPALCIMTSQGLMPARNACLSSRRQGKF